MAGVDKGKNGFPTEHLPDGWQDWPTLREAANLIGMTSVRLSSYAKVGAIKKYVAPNAKGSLIGSYRFDPADLEALSNSLADEEEAEKVPTTADTVRASVEGLKQSQAHAERFVTLFEEPYKFVLTTLREENAALRTECAALRAERKQLEELREQTRSTQAIEAIAMAELKGEQHTKEQALELAKPVLKHFINAALLKGGVDPKLIALKDAVEGVPRTTYEALFASGILPDEVVAKLKVGLAWEEAPPP